jgi:hypothetical protein
MDLGHLSYYVTADDNVTADEYRSASNQRVKN